MKAWLCFFITFLSGKARIVWFTYRINRFSTFRPAFAIRLCSCVLPLHKYYYGIVVVVAHFSLKLLYKYWQNWWDSFNATAHELVYICCSKEDDLAFGNDQKVISSLSTTIYCRRGGETLALHIIIWRGDFNGARRKISWQKRRIKGGGGVATRWAERPKQTTKIIEREREVFNHRVFILCCPFQIQSLIFVSLKKNSNETSLQKSQKIWTLRFHRICAVLVKIEYADIVLHFGFLTQFLGAYSYTCNLF